MTIEEQLTDAVRERDAWKRALEQTNAQIEKLAEATEPRLSRHPLTVVQAAAHAFSMLRDVWDADMEMADDFVRCAKFAMAKWEETEKERDEARAEVKRLREMAHDFEAMREDRDHHASALKQERREVERLQGDVWALTTTLRNLPVPSPSLTDACTDAYRRGAAAMREACAKKVNEYWQPSARQELFSAISALPIPEET